MIGARERQGGLLVSCALIGLLSALMLWAGGVAAPAVAIAQSHHHGHAQRHKRPAHRRPHRRAPHRRPARRRPAHRRPSQSNDSLVPSLPPPSNDNTFENPYLDSQGKGSAKPPPPRGTPVPVPEPIPHDRPPVPHPTPAPSPSSTPAATPAPSDSPGGSEVIEDPELAGTAASPASAGASDSGVIDDPELAGTPPPPPPEPEQETESDDSGGGSDTSTYFVLDYHSRLGVDTRWQNNSEEVLDNQNYLTLEIHHTASEKLRLAVGARLRYTIDSQRSFSAKRDAWRFGLDLLPTAAYIDLTPAPPVHVRVGYQVLRLGSFEVWNATDVLSVIDFRSGAATPLDEMDVATPAVRLDWDIKQWLSLTAIYVPFFQPHYYNPAGSDYALVKLPGSDAVETVIETLNQTIGRSYIPSFTANLLRDAGPAPSFKYPQGALQLTAHGNGGEVTLTVATALDHFGGISFSPYLQSLFNRYFTGTDPTLQTVQDLVNQATMPPMGSPAPFTVTFPRFWVTSFGATIDAGWLQLGTEVAYYPNRVLYAAADNYLPVPQRADLVHVGFRMEHVADVNKLVALEGFVEYPLETPTDTVDLSCAADPNAPRPCMNNIPRQWFTFAGGRVNYGVALISRWAPIQKLWFELASVFVQGPSFLAVPRMIYWPNPQLFFELGGVAMAGPSPKSPGAATTSIGGVYKSANEIFVGVGYRR